MCTRCGCSFRCRRPLLHGDEAQRNGGEADDAVECEAEHLPDRVFGFAGEARGALIRAAAVHRSEAAFDWLLEIIATGASRHAQAAADALAVYERNARLIERIQAAKARRSD